jgi:hypothetical protein
MPLRSELERPGISLRPFLERRPPTVSGLAIPEGRRFKFSVTVPSLNDADTFTPPCPSIRAPLKQLSPVVPDELGVRITYDPEQRMIRAEARPPSACALERVGGGLGALSTRAAVWRAEWAA